MDWTAYGEHLFGRLTAFVRELRALAPELDLYAVAVHEFYAEQGGVIACTLLGAADEQWLGRAAQDDEEALVLRWSPADWPWQSEPTAEDQVWAERLTAAAGTAPDWDAVYDQYEDVVVAACNSAREALIAEGVVGGGFAVLAIEESWSLVARTATPEQIQSGYVPLD